MEVILQENYPSLGYVGDIVKVRSGFARNYLIPRGIASEASSRNARELKHRLANIEAKKRRLKGEAEELAKRIAGESLTFRLKGTDRSRLFGSVTPKEIWSELTSKGFELERKQIKLAEPIKAAGSYTATVQLHSEVTVELPVTVEADVSGKRASNRAEEGQKVDRIESSSEELTSEENEVLEEQSEE